MDRVQELIAVLALTDWDYEIVGGIRRYDPTVNYIPLLVGVKSRDSICKRLQELTSGWYWPKQSSRDDIARWQIDRVEIKAITSTRDEWAGRLLRDTGPRPFYKALCIRARQAGLRLRINGLRDPYGIIAYRTEEEILRALSLPYIHPWERGEVYDEIRREKTTRAFCPAVYQRRDASGDQGAPESAAERCVEPGALV